MRGWGSVFYHLDTYHARGKKKLKYKQDKSCLSTCGMKTKVYRGKR